jgi:hypothetical protein
MKPTIVICFLLTLISSCSKNPNCWGDDKLKGDIGISIELDEIDCMPAENNIDADEFVIRNETELLAVVGPGCHIPEIDFSERTLVGKYVSGKCNARFIREVEKSGNGYTYTIKVSECGLCNAAVISYNWVLIPAVDSSKQVVFDVKR